MNKSNKETMKKIITLSVFALVFTLQTKAQQVPLYSQLYFMRMLYNPALTAYNGSSNLYGFYREQWTGMPGHPVTRGAVGEVSLWKDQSGVGFHLYNDNTDIIHRLNAQVYYAQKVRFAKDHQLSLGVSLGIMNTRVDFNNAVANDLDDVHLLSAGKSATSYDMSVGLAYQWKGLTIGFSVPQVANTNTRIATQMRDSKYAMKRHYIIGASYDVSLAKDKFHLEPSVLVKLGPSKPVQVDVNVMADYKRMVFLGLGYRLDFGLAMMAAVRISHAVTLGYAFDYPIQKSVEFSSTRGTHELIFGLNFDRWIKKKKTDDNNFVKKSDFDSLAAKTQQIRNDLDSTKQAVDSSQQKNIEQDGKIKELQDRANNLEKQIAEYKKALDENPPKDFSNSIDKNTEASTGDIFRLNNVTFERNSSYLKESSYAELDRLVEFMKENPKTHIRILGHTDIKASDEYNDWLSNNRAKRVYDYLISKKVPADKMVFLGMGKRVPIADNTTEEGRAQNRRVEVEIGKKDK